MRDVWTAGVAPSLAIPLALVEDAFRRLEKRLDGMTEEEFHFTGPGEANSTAMLLRHLILVDLTYLHIMMGDMARVPEIQQKYGPFQDERGRIPGVGAASGRELLEEYRGVIEKIRQYVSGLTDEDAEREVKVPWWPDSATLRYMLWHMASHSSHHQGQIARLRAAYKQRA